MDNPNASKLPVIRDRVFREGEKVNLSGFRYENCQFHQCIIRYVGGPGEMYDCYIAPNTIWEFSDHVATILEVLRLSGWRIEYGTGPDAEPIRFPSDAM